MALLPAAGSGLEIKDTEVVFLHILSDAPHGPGSLRDDEGVSGFHQCLAALRVFNLGGAFGNDAQLRARMAGKFKRARPAIPYARVHFSRGMGDVPPDIGERIAVQNMLGTAGHMFHGLFRSQKNQSCVHYCSNFLNDVLLI